jgi:hypothetical protein
VSEDSGSRRQFTRSTPLDHVWEVDGVWKLFFHGEDGFCPRHGITI